MCPVREFAEDDITEVADLNWNVLRHGHGPSSPALKDYFQKLFLHNPWFDKRFPSLVFEDKGGKIIGFLGVIPRPMSARGKSIFATFGSNFVVHPEGRSTLAGLHLVKTYLEGKQDLSISDSANDLTAQVQKGLGATTLPLESMHWSRPLRASQYALDAFSRLRRDRFSKLLKGTAKPFCMLIDGVGASAVSNGHLDSGSSLKAEPLTVETLLQCLAKFPSRFSLRPSYDLASLRWLLDFMDEMKAFGTVHRSAVFDEKKDLIGWYIYSLRSSEVGEVVQIGAAPRHRKDVLNHLFQNARHRGAIGLHGRLDAEWLQDLSESGCFFYRRGGWMQAHSRNPELIQLLKLGDSYLTRLDGEWCLSCH
jgi:hypothetical protein